MKVYDLIEEAIDVYFMDIPNITSIILDYIETNIYYLDYIEVDNTVLDPDYDEKRFILKACILATNEDEAYDLFVSHFNTIALEKKFGDWIETDEGEFILKPKQLIDKYYFIGNLTKNEDRRYFTIPKVHHIFTEKKCFGLDRKFRHIFDIYDSYEYKHNKGSKSNNGRRYVY